MPARRDLHKTQVTFWAVPLAYAAAALVLGTIVPRIASAVLPGLVSTISVNAAIGLYSAVASGMIALTGIVFSLTFLMVQFSATAYSPRLVLWVARDPVLSHAMGVFTATFLYALAALAWVDRSGAGRVPLVGVVAVTGLLVVSVIMFITLIQRVGLLQVSRMLIFTGDQARGVIEELYPPLETPHSTRSSETLPPRPVQTLMNTTTAEVHSTLQLAPSVLIQRIAAVFAFEFFLNSLRTARLSGSPGHVMPSDPRYIGDRQPQFAFLRSPHSIQSAAEGQGPMLEEGAAACRIQMLTS